MLLKKHSREIRNGFGPHVPSEFTSLEQARNSLDYHWNNCIDFFLKVENNHCYHDSTGIGGQGPLDALKTVETVRQEHFDVYERWSSAFQAFLEKHEKSLDSRSLQAVRTLEISHSFAMIFLNVSTVNVLNDETAWDRHTENYEYIVNLAALIIKASTRENFTENRGPTFTLDMNIVAPLYAVV